MQKSKQETPNEKKSSLKAAKHAAPKENKSGFSKVLIVCFTAIIIVLLGLTIYANSYDGIFPNTYVNGTLVSDMSDAELSNFVTSVYSEQKLDDSKLLVSCKDQNAELSVKDLDIHFDHAASVEKIVTSGKDGNIFQAAITFVSRLFNPVNINPVMTYNKELLLKTFDDVTAGYEVEPVGYTFNIEKDSVIIHNRVNGIKADRDSAVLEFESQISAMATDKVELNPVPVTPAPIDFEEFYKWLTSDAQDAYFEKVDGKVIVRDSKAKCEVDKQIVKDALSTLESSSEPTVTIPVKTTEPQTTSEKLNEILYRDKLGSYSTNFGGSSASRANNVRLATSRIAGTELMPGEEFSYDKTILPRTSANGYMPAGVYVGNKSDVGMGGGICQPSSTLYAASLYANLEIVERHNHSLTISYLPPGLDATIAEGYLDLRIRNNTNYPIKIDASADGGVVSFSIYGYNENNTSVDIERSFSGGAYHVTRVVKENGVEVKREKMGSSVYGVPEKDKPEEKKPEEEKPEQEKPEQENAEVPNTDNTDTQAPVESNPGTATETPSPAVPETPPQAPSSPAQPPAAAAPNTPTVPETPAVGE